MLHQDLWLLLEVYLISFWWQWLSWPLLLSVFSNLKDGGWALGRVFSTVFISWIMWSVGHLGLGINNDWGLYTIVLGISVINLYYWHHKGNLAKKYFFSKRQYILAEELLFAICLFGYGVLRGFGPDLNGAEKFMDLGFIKQYLLTLDLPADDMWMAGKTINYYSFGHYWISIIIRSIGVIPEVGYNVAVALLFGWVGSLAVSFTVNLLSIKNWWLSIAAGVTSALVLLLGGNGHIWWFMIRNKGLVQEGIPYWYGLATRFIEGTITEFPGYTFTIADLHPHLIDLPIVLVFLITMVVISGRKKMENQVIFLGGWLIGVMIMTNTWDALMYLLLLTIVVFFKILNKEITLLGGLGKLVIITSTGLLVSATWWTSFIPIPQGIGLVSERSSIGKLLVIWTPHLVLGVVAWVTIQKNYLLKSLLIVSLLLIVIPEFFYIKDVHIDTPRINTVFKFTYQSVVLLSLTSGVALASVIEKKNWLLSVLILTIILGLLTYPLTSYSNRYGNKWVYKGLNGGVWLEEKEWEEDQMVKYLSSNRDGKNMIDYPGQSFTLHNAVSVYSGVPTVLGWRTHEWLWRGWPEVRDRIQDIEKFYAGGVEVKKEIISKYNIGWVKVGKKERDNWTINDVSMTKIGDIVWQSGDSYLLKVRDELQ